MNHPCSLAAMALLSALAASAGPNLLPGGSFEEADAQGAVAGWTTDTAGMQTVRFVRDTEAARSGTASARIDISSADNPSWPAYCFKLAVQPGQSYHVEAWIRTRDVVRVAYVATDYLDAQDQRVTFSSGGTVSGTTADWKQVSVVSQIPVGAVSMVVKLILYGSGTAWFDDVTLVRDEAFEAGLARLRQPLPAAWVTRGTTRVGDLARLQRLFQAAAKGGHYTLGVIGGSITAGGCASSVDMRYAAYVLNWFKEHFPAAEWTLVNAGIGATGTNYACLRAQRDLLARSPDLVVSEFAVNDGNSQDFAETYEGLLRQILTSARQPPVLLLFMMNQAGGNAQEWQSKLGQHYGLPMLSYRDMLWPEIEAKRLNWADLSPDAVHPHDVGHGYAGKLLTALLDHALASVPPAALPAPPSALPAALLTAVYQFTHLFEADELQPAANTGWAYDAGSGWDKAWKASTPGSVLEFEVSGEQLFVSYWRIRGPMGQARITIDGGQPSLQDAWFEQTWGGYRHMIKLPMGGPGKHRVRFELLAEKHAESTGTEFRLLCLGTAGM